MPRFQYSAVNSEGKRSKGELEAPNREIAVNYLLQRGLTPLAMRTEGVRRWRRTPVLTGDELLSLLRDLSNLVLAAIPLEPALGLAADQMSRPSAQALVTDLRQRVRAGESLARALAAHTGVFAPDVIGMVAAGEQGGMLAVSLQHLAVLAEDRAQFRQRLVSAMIYPALLAVMTLAALALLAGYVIPQFEELFAGTKAHLPASTLAVLAVGNFLGRYGPLLLAAAAGFGLFCRAALRRDNVRDKFDAFVLRRTGPIGRLIRDSQLALYVRTLAGLLSGGVPLAVALGTASACLGNRCLAAAGNGLQRRVRNGESLSRAAAAEPLLPSRLVRLLAVAEQTASLPQALLDLAKLLERERGMALDRALSLLTPVLTLLLGGMIGMIFAALISGLMSLNDIAI